MQELGFTQIRAVEASAIAMKGVEASTVKVGATKVDQCRTGFRKLGTFEVAVAQIGPAELGLRQLNARPSRMVEISTFEVRFSFRCRQREQPLAVEMVTDTRSHRVARGRPGHEKASEMCSGL